MGDRDDVGAFVGVEVTGAMVGVAVGPDVGERDNVGVLVGTEVVGVLLGTEEGLLVTGAGVTGDKVGLVVGAVGAGVTGELVGATVGGRH